MDFVDRSFDHKVGIYGIKNKINGYIYVGKAASGFRTRYRSHCNLLNKQQHFNKQLQLDWDEYGEDAFEFVILEECSTDELKQKEQYYIKYYRDKDLAYNKKPGGEGGIVGSNVSDNTKKKMSESQNNRYEQWTEEDRKAWGKLSSESARGYKWDEESKKKMKGNKNPATHTYDQIKEMRRLYEEENKTCREIADIFGESREYVYNIVTYRRWKEV